MKALLSQFLSVSWLGPLRPPLSLYCLLCSLVLDGPTLRLTGWVAGRHLCVVHALQATVVQAHARVAVDQLLSLVLPLLIVVIVLHAGHHHYPIRWGVTVLHCGTAQLVAQHLALGQREEL